MILFITTAVRTSNPKQCMPSADCAEIASLNILIQNIYLAFERWHHVELDYVANTSEEPAATIFSVK
jgi:hypothetical protein